MKKILVVLTVLSLVLGSFGFVCAADEIPAIDPEAAKDYVGVWYLAGMCDETSCLNLADFGMGDSTLELNEDNTAAMSTFDESGELAEPDVAQWYFDAEAQVAYLVESETEPSLMEINEDGYLYFGTDEFTLVFAREQSVPYGFGEILDDAVFEDYSGKWVLYSMQSDDSAFPVCLLGVTGSLDIRENDLDLDFMGATENAVPYELTDGAILFSTGEPGTDGEMPVCLFYEDDDTVIMFVTDDEENPTSENSMVFVFLREEYAPSENLLAMFSDSFGFVEESFESEVPEEIFDSIAE